MKSGSVKIILAFLLILFIAPTATVQLYWKINTPAGFYFPGFLQSDQVTYTALFRSVITRGNGITYSYPYAAPGPENPPVYFQAPFTLLAWMWQVLGGNLLAPWEVLRYASAAIFFLALFLFARELFKRFYPTAYESNALPGYLVLFITVLLFGGGLAWFISLFKFILIKIGPRENPAGFLAVFGRTEGVYHWWFLNLFRNVFYPLELFYHALFFLALLGCLKKNPILIFTAQLLACLSGVFVGIQVSLLLILFFLVQALDKPNRETLLHLALANLVFLLMISYYKSFLPRHLIPAVLIEQHRESLYDLIPVHKYFAAYGLLVFSTPLVFLSQKFRKRMIQRREGRLVLCWLVVEGALILNDKFLPGKGFQPPHFTRGYFYSALVAVTALGVFPLWRKVIEKGGGKILLTAALVLAIFLPDNILFVAGRLSEPPHPSVLTITRHSKDTLDFLHGLEREQTVFCPERKFGYLVPAFTRHSSIFAELYVTPFNREKTRQVEDFFQNQGVEEFIHRYRISLIVLPGYPKLLRHFERNIKLPEWKRIYQNPGWRVYRVNGRFGP